MLRFFKFFRTIQKKSDRTGKCPKPALPAGRRDSANLRKKLIEEVNPMHIVILTVGVLFT